MKKSKSETTESLFKNMKKCIDEINSLPKRIGTSVYVRIEKDGQYQMLDITSKELYEFMFRQMFDNNVLIDRQMWKSSIDYILGGYTIERMKEQKNRIAIENNAIYYDILDLQSYMSHYVKITTDGWDVIEGNLDSYEWNSFQMAQVIPDKKDADIKCLRKYLNLDENDALMFFVYLVSCFIPNIQHPILNISGEHGTGKSTISTFLKDLVDPSSSPKNDFSDGKDGIKLPLSQNYLTVFDNVESLPSSLNSVFCRAVTGGDTLKRKLYSDNKMIAIPLKSIVVMNGLTSEIRKEDLMSRTIFLQTKPIAKNKNKDIGQTKLDKDFEKDKKYILGGIFDTLSKAMANFKESKKVTTHFRLMDFAKWGYVIAETLGDGNGIKFLELMKRNETIQLQEAYSNEPLISLLSNYMTLRKGEDVCMLTSKFYEKIMKDCDTYLGNGSTESKKMLPKTAAAFSKRLNSLKGVFLKLGISIEIDRTNDVRNVSQITISMVDEINCEDCHTDMNESIKKPFKRVPIVGIRKPIIKEML